MTTSKRARKIVLFPKSTRIIIANLFFKPHFGTKLFCRDAGAGSIQAHVTNKTSRLSAQTTSSLTVLITKTEQGIRTKWRNKLIPRSHYLQGFRGDIVINTNYNTILTLFRRAWSTGNKVLPPSTKQYNSRFSNSQTI